MRGEIQGDNSASNERGRERGGDMGFRKHLPGKGGSLSAGMVRV